MRKRLNSFLAMVCIICMFMTTLSCVTMQVEASNEIKIAGIGMGYSAGEYFSTTGKACTCHNQGLCVPQTAQCTCIHVAGTAQCYAWALWCEEKLFGNNDVNNPKLFYSLGSIATGSVTASSIKNLLYGKAKPGAHIRTKAGSATNHSMIIVSIDENGFTVAQANGLNNNEYSGWSSCRIGTSTYTWESYASSTYGKRGIEFVKMPYDYNLNTESPSFSVNLTEGQILSGTAFPITGTVNNGGTYPWLELYMDYTYVATTCNNENGDYAFYLDTTQYTDGEHLLGVKMRNEDGFDYTAWYNIIITNSSQPVGLVESIEVGTKSVNIRGWAYDPDDLNRAVGIHVYIGQTCIGTCVADLYRPDVNSNIGGVGEYHGFNITCSVPQELTGTQSIKVFAIDEEGINHPMLDSMIDSTVTIPDTVLPIGLVGSVEAGINKVTVTGWAYDPDDLNRAVGIHVYIGQTCIGTCVADSYRPDLNTNEGHLGVGEYHGFNITCNVPQELTGTQSIAVYAIDEEGTYHPTLGSTVDTTVIISNDTEEPVISDVVVSDISETGYTVSCKAVDSDSGISRVQFPTWTLENEQDDLDLEWRISEKYRGTKDGDTYTFRVNISDHNYEYGVYQTHIYAYDNNGNLAGYNVESITISKHEHIFNGKTEIITEADCINSGLSKVYCSKDGCEEYEETVIEAIGHKWDEGTVTKEVTCEEEGVRIYTCSGCEDTKTEEIAKLEHTKVVDKAVEATCTESGLTEGSHCSVCETVLEKQETVAAKGHNWGEGEVTKAATCKETGIRTYTCTGCKDAKTEEIAKLAHTKVVDKAVEATCTESGLTEGSHCSVCETVLAKQETVEAKGHSWETEYTVDKEADCKNAGSKSIHCEVCDEIKEGSEVTIEASAHNWGEGEVTKAATCKETGIRTYTCTGCKDTKTEAIEKLAHTKVIDKAVEATCTESGLTEGSHCSVCETVLEKQETVEAKGHSWEIEYTVDKEADCKNAGSKSIHCEVCDEIKEGSEVTIEASAHNWGEGEVTKAATCKETGIRTYTCTGCKDTKTEAIAKLAHTKVIDKAVEATCTESGLTEGSHCSVCETVLEKQETVAAKGHSWETEYTIDKEADCKNAGSKSIHCEVCDEIKEGSEVTIEASAHNWGEGEVTKTATCKETGIRTYTCTGCKDTKTEEIAKLAHTKVIDKAVEATCTENGLTEGSHCSVCETVLEKQETIEATGHSWNEGVVGKEANCKETGVITYTCTKCYETKDETIAAKGHSWESAYTVDKEANCVENGTKSIHCSVCDEVKEGSEVTIEASDHNWGDGVVTKGESCTESGERTYTCLGCRQTKTETIDVLGHSWEADYTVDKAATCTTEGSMSIHCSVCKAINPENVEKIPVLEHPYEEWTTITTPTYTSNGLLMRTCTVCGNEQTKGINKYTLEKMTLDMTNKEVVVGDTFSLKVTCTPVAPAEGEVIWSSSDTSVAVVDEKGKITAVGAGSATIKASIGDTSVGCEVTVEAKEEPVIPRNPFTDVLEGRYYYNPVLWAVENGITNGMTATTFVPDNSCTRAQIVTFLWRAYGSPEPTTTASAFTDVVPGSFYEKAVAWAVENGITTGTTSTTFSPGAICTREQTVTFLWRANGKPAPSTTTNPFTDVNESGFAYSAILWAVENGITNGMTADTFAPKTECSRGQVVTFLYRALC